MTDLACIYARVSSDAQRKEGTIAAQLRDVPAFCAARGWQVDLRIVTPRRRTA